MLKKTKGFSLLEAVVALFVLSMITLTFLNSTSIFVSSQKKFVEKNKYDQIADLILQDMMEYRKKVSNPYGSITADAQTFTTNDKTLSVSNVSTMPKVGDILIIDNLSKRFTVESIAGTTPDSVTITTEENLPVTTITSSNITFIAFKKDDLSCFDGLDLTGSVPSSLTNCPSLPSEVTNLFNHWKSIIDNELGSTVTTRTIDVADDGLVTVTLGDGTENVSLAKKINLCIFNNAPTSVAFTFPGLTNPITTGIISHDENPTAHYYADGIARKFGSLTADSSETDDSTSSDCDKVQYSTCRQAYAWEDTISVFLYRYTGPDVRVKPSACDSDTSWQCPGVRINQNDLSLWFIFDEFNYEDDSVDSTWVDQNVSGWNEGGYLRYTTSNLPANARVLVFDDASESCMNNITSGSCTGRYKWGEAHDGLVIHLGTGNLNELSDINLTLSGNPSPMDIDKWRVLKNEPDCLKASGVSGSAHGDATNREDKDECWQYVSVTEDSLASALAEGATTMVLNDSSKFPSSGTLQIGSEFVHFTSNDLTTNTITLSIRGSRPTGILAEDIPANGMGGDWTTQTLTGDNLLTGFQGGYVEIGSEIFEIDYGNDFSNLDNKTIIFKSRGERGSSMSSHTAGASVKNYDMRDQDWPLGTAVYEGPPNSVPIVMAKTGSGDNENYPRKRLKKKVTLNLSSSSVCQ